MPIPHMAGLRKAAKTARDFPILLESAENKEQAIDVRSYGIAGDNYYFRTDNPPYMHRAKGAIPELYLREGVLRRLLRVNEELGDLGLELYLYDAYRPVEVQNYFFDEWMPRVLREQYPYWSEHDIREETKKYWEDAVPDILAIDPYAPPPHLTGAVFDLTIRVRDTKEELPMGTLFDDNTIQSFADFYERESEHRLLAPSEIAAMEHRRLLYHMMRSEGFMVYPDEWWHFGVGDQLSAKLSGDFVAVYSLLLHLS